jgi:multimeric flavodoxin WrbA
MNVIAFNGSPRKKWNTATLLEKALEGAASRGARTELIHLYDLDYKGCRSCYSCKLKGGRSLGKCAAKDDLTVVLEKVADADAIILGAPIYMGAVAGEAQSFLERLVYPLWDAENMGTFFEKRIPAGFICTMGAPESRMKEMGFDRCISTVEMMLGMAFGRSESLVVTDTWQFDDYSLYLHAPNVDPEAKARRRKVEFPRDCERAFEMGVRFAGATCQA